ncbi:MULTISPECIES: hypothetical protein [Paenibacillus]|uniref:Uncharacterized protein n=1 Tax=Paenibacillus amylolyticus TaxID=1451 RepID=A0ABD8AV33_PAEAM|nr:MULTISPECIES: hypothetical protein [Paenibacillus]PJN65751.1 hypothetical protein PAEAM_04340 [Paenibacillus sp. GM1FR]WFA83926.1 hypothetical protein OGI70_23590 [Paenibacillus amylolyticus]
MGDIHKVAEPDHIIKDVVGKFPCRVLWSEGRPCLEYQGEEDVALITEYVHKTYNVELLDVFFTAVESLPVEP